MLRAKLNQSFTQAEKDKKNTRVVPSCHTVSTTSRKRMRGSSIVALSCTALGVNSILPPQRVVEPVVETQLLKHDISELHISEGLGSVQGRILLQVHLGFILPPPLQTCRGRCRRHNAKLGRPLVCSGVSILMFNLTQLQSFFRRGFVFLKCVSLSFFE